jgi:long-chain acyl-CoA synthetase
MCERVEAVIVRLLGECVDPREVFYYAREQLADFKVPQCIAVNAEPLPRGPASEILTSRLRDIDFGEPV